MDTKNPKKGKKGPWIKIVAAVVIVGALVAVGVLGIQGDWLQGRTNLRMVTGQPKTTATMPITTPITKVPTITQPVIRIISDSRAFDGQNITVTHPATITFKPSTEKNGSWSWEKKQTSINCILTYDPEKMTCTTINPKKPTYNTIRYQWQEGTVTQRAVNEIKVLVNPQALTTPTEITIPVDIPPPLTVEDERPPLTVPVTITSNPPATKTRVTAPATKTRVTAPVQDTITDELPPFEPPSSLPRLFNFLDVQLPTVENPYYCFPVAPTSSYTYVGTMHLIVEGPSDAIILKNNWPYDGSATDDTLPPIPIFCVKFNKTGEYAITVMDLDDPNPAFHESMIFNVITIY